MSQNVDKHEKLLAVALVQLLDEYFELEQNKDFSKQIMSKVAKVKKKRVEGTLDLNTAEVYIGLILRMDIVAFASNRVIIDLDVLEHVFGTVEDAQLTLNRLTKLSTFKDLDNKSVLYYAGKLDELAGKKSLTVSLLQLLFLLKVEAYGDRTVVLAHFFYSQLNIAALNPSNQF